MGKRPVKKPKKSLDWSEDQKRNIVGVFEILIEMDKKQYPENYKNERIDKAFDILFKEVSDTDKQHNNS